MNGDPYRAPTRVQRFKDTAAVFLTGLLVGFLAGVWAAVVFMSAPTEGVRPIVEPHPADLVDLNREPRRRIEDLSRRLEASD